MGGGLDIRLDLLEKHQHLFIEEADHMIDSLLAKKITPDEWAAFLRSELNSLYVTASVVGAQDAGLVKSALYGKIEEQLAVQEPYIHRFAAQLAQDDRVYSKKALLARCDLYAHSADEWVERGLFKAQQLPDLPFYPKSWSECRHHCKCHWRFEKIPGRPNDYDVYWVLAPEVEHCRTCQNRARYCNPLYIRDNVWTNNLPYELLFARL